MNRTEFESLVARMELSAAANRSSTLARAGLGAMGYGFLMLVVATLLALVVGAS